MQVGVLSYLDLGLFVVYVKEDVRLTSSICYDSRKLPGCSQRRRSKSCLTFLYTCIEEESRATA